MQPLVRSGSGFVVAAAAAAAALIASCGGGGDGPAAPDPAVIEAMTVTAKPSAPTQTAVVGTTALGIASPRDGFLYVPSSYDPATKTPLAVFLHGPNELAITWNYVKAFADANGVVLLAIDSRFTTWDIVETGAYGPDVVFLNSALQFVFDRVNVDPFRIALVGFSDGGTEALGIGIANAGLFRRVMAFAPGALASPFARGFPAIFISHGNQDDQRSYDNTRDFIVPSLVRQGFPVEFVPFEGGHEIPNDVMDRAFTLFLTKGS